MATARQEGQGLTPEEQSLLDGVSPEKLQVWLEWFSTLGLRLAGTEAETAGAEYIVAELRSLGVETDLLEFDSFVSYGDDPLAFGPAVVETVGSETRRWHGKIYAFGAPTGTNGVEAEVVWVGSGSPADYERLAADVHGKVALSELSFDAPHGEPARVATEHGGIGVIVINWSDAHPDFIHTGTARGTWGNPTPDDFDRLPSIPMVALSRRDGVALRRLVEAGGVRARLTAQTHRAWAPSKQPVADIRGRSDRFVLVYCHLDAFGAGMTDNATGVVGLMELARVLAGIRDRLNLSVRFAWWAGHEMPYNGSTWYLDTHWDDLRDNCVAVMNADSWAIGDSKGQVELWTFAEFEQESSGWVRDVIGDGASVTDFDAKEAEQSFWSMGIPSAMVFSLNPSYDEQPGMAYLGPWFHTEHDTIDRVGVAALVELVQTYTVGVSRLATASRLPFRYSATARKIAGVLRDIVPTAPSSVALAELVQQADQLADRCATLEARPAAPYLDAAVMRLGRILNPVIYSIAGPYGQDPSSASYLRKRLPGLARALDGAATARDRDIQLAHITSAMRERNRLSDALQAATAVADRALAT